MEREVGGGIGMGNTCKPLAVSFQCMTKSTTNLKKKKKKEFTGAATDAVSGSHSIIDSGVLNSEEWGWEEHPH